MVNGDFEVKLSAALHDGDYKALTQNQFKTKLLFIKGKIIKASTTTCTIKPL